MIAKLSVYFQRAAEIDISSMLRGLADICICLMFVTLPQYDRTLSGAI